jgi:S-formylglutathione hydrolase FrmB
MNAPLLLAALLFQSAPTRFEISVRAATRPEPLTGRVYVMISRTNETEPRLQISQTGGTPLFGRDVEALPAGSVAVLDASDLGSPVPSLTDIPAGDYFVQAFVNVYTEFHRADGHTVWMHDDQWEGQKWNLSPGNLYSQVERVHLDSARGYTVRLVADRTIPPVEIPPDTKWVKRFRFQSPRLSTFWGRPIYLGATVLLPRDYDTETTSYPVIYNQGHFSLQAPLRFREGDELYREWIEDDFPRMLVVTFQHPTPYFDDSYAVNSANVGPYGDAILEELVPEVEKRFRAIREPWARALTGGSTGGWEALALQLFHPDFFGGTWAYCPDPVTFSAYEGIDVYKDENAFYKDYGWYRVPTSNIRDIYGQVRLTAEQKNHFELACGTHGRSGYQMDIWAAVFGPLGEDGYYRPLFDKRTGVIDKEVSEYWKENYDLLYYMQKNWATLGPRIEGKLHVYTGDMDTFYLDKGVVLMQEWMKSTENPHYEAFFLYGDRKPHCWIGPVTEAERLREIAQYMMTRMPGGTTTPWWKY